MQIFEESMKKLAESNGFSVIKISTYGSWNARQALTWYKQDRSEHVVNEDIVDSKIHLLPRSRVILTYLHRRFLLLICITTYCHYFNLIYIFVFRRKTYLGSSGVRTSSLLILPAAMTG